jgi:hypothetical protein
LTHFTGILSTSYPESGDMKDYADYIQGLGDKIAAMPSSSSGDITGAFTNIMSAGDKRTRCLYYATSALDARLMAAAYIGRYISVNFAGSNTLGTMNMKELVTIDPDESLDDSILDACAIAGVDVYANIAGLPKVISNGANGFADSVYSLIWFVGKLQVNGFNALATVSTKIPQTEPGMSILKGAYRQACEQGINCGYIAAGAWNSGERFGNPDDMLRNISDRGYYIYSQPVNQQSQSDREDRKAPLIQKL